MSAKFRVVFIDDFCELLVNTGPPTVSSGNVAEDGDNVSNRFLPSPHAKAGLAPRVILVSRDAKD